MSTIYRKSGREFYKVDQKTKVIIRVLNKEALSKIDISENGLLYEDACVSQLSTEEEFNTAYTEAMDRITSGIV